MRGAATAPLTSTKGVVVVVRHLRRLVGALSVLAMVFLSSAITPGRAAARPAQRAHASRAAAVTESAKVTLNETSIAGPGFNGVVIAWTGTDAAHHLNARIGSPPPQPGSGNLSFPSKTTFPETSSFGPALSMLPSAGGAPPDFAVAWTGTDTHHSLNVEEIGGPKLTLDETSIATPALAFGNISGTARLLLAWTGTDASHSLNVLPLTPNGSESFDIGTKTVLSQFSSDAGPTLFASFSSGGGIAPPTTFVLGWSGRATQQLNLAESPDAVTFSSALVSRLPETSATPPQLIQSSATNACIAWTGTDAAQHLNVQCTTHFPQFPDPVDTKTVLPERALGAPGFADNSASEIAWTGTDAAHHLNVAQLAGV
jgi:hypothetical protein